MAERKPFLLRLDPVLFEALQRWANDDLRSLNGQVEFLLRDALRKAGRWPKARRRRAAVSMAGTDCETHERPLRSVPRGNRQESDRRCSSHMSSFRTGAMARQAEPGSAAGVRCSVAVIGGLASALIGVGFAQGGSRDGLIAIACVVAGLAVVGGIVLAKVIGRQGKV